MDHAERSGFVQTAFRGLTLEWHMKTRTVSLLATLLAAAPAAHAQPTDVVFQGGIVVTSTSGCTNWDPVKQLGWGTYWVPVAGSTNGPDSVITFRFGTSAEGFQLNNGVLTPAFKPMDAFHIYTRVGNYPAFGRVTSQIPATITTATQRVTVLGAIKGWDHTPTCVVNFSLNAVRDLNP
jgi:hypothetical protein